MSSPAEVDLNSAGLLAQYQEAARWCWNPRIQHHPDGHAVACTLRRARTCAGHAPGPG